MYVNLVLLDNLNHGPFAYFFNPLGVDAFNNDIATNRTDYFYVLQS